MSSGANADVTLADNRNYDWIRRYGASDVDGEDCRLVFLGFRHLVLRTSSCKSFTVILLVVPTVRRISLFRCAVCLSVKYACECISNDVSVYDIKTVFRIVQK